MAEKRKPLTLSNLRPARGSTSARKRVGRGPGSGLGKTSLLQAGPETARVEERYPSFAASQTSKSGSNDFIEALYNVRKFFGRSSAKPCTYALHRKGANLADLDPGPLWQL